MPKKLDLTGQKFGKLTVLKESKERKNGLVTWECECECGTKPFLATTKYLRSQRSDFIKSCGCAKRKDLIGQKFGKLTVIEYTKENRHGSALWKCQCDCGNITYATTEGLRVGDNVSCGCSNKGMEKFKERYCVDFVGKKFGNLLVLEKTNERSNKGNVIWKCKCDCGNECYVSTNHLQTGNTKSCGCLIGHSAGEQEIKTLLENNNIIFKQEYSFVELPNRRYDFAIFDKNKQLIKLIEFDGEQHYIENNFFKDNLEKIQERDSEKTNFAKNKNITLIRVPYWKRGNITLKDLEL